MIGFEYYVLMKIIKNSNLFIFQSYIITLHKVLSFNESSLIVQIKLSHQ